MYIYCVNVYRILYETASIMPYPELQNVLPIYTAVQLNIYCIHPYKNVLMLLNLQI